MINGYNIIQVRTYYMSNEEIFMKVLSEFLSKSKEEMNEIDNDERYDDGVFSTFKIDGEEDEDFNIR